MTKKEMAELTRVYNDAVARVRELDDACGDLVQTIKGRYFLGTPGQLRMFPVIAQQAFIATQAIARLKIGRAHV